MLEQIKVKHGIKRKLVPIVAIFLVVIYATFFILGLIDLRTPEQKTEEEKAKFLSKPYIQETIEAINIVRFDIAFEVDFISVTHLKGSKYFSIKYFHNNKEIIAYYDRSTNKKISESTWIQKVSNILSSSLYFGDNSDPTFTITGDDLLKVQRYVRGEIWQ